MNRLNVTIKEVREQDGICDVILEGCGDVFSALVLNPGEKPVYAAGEEVQIVFKDTALCLAKDWSGSLSARNRFSSSVRSLEQGRVVTKVVLDYKGILLHALISTASARELRLQAGDAVTGLVKSTAVSIYKEQRL